MFLTRPEIKVGSISGGDWMDRTVISKPRNQQSLLDLSYSRSFVVVRNHQSFCMHNQTSYVPPAKALKAFCCVSSKGSRCLLVRIIYLQNNGWRHSLHWLRWLSRLY